MAKAIAEGARTVPKMEAELNYYVAPETLNNFDAIVVGVPTYHHHMAVDIKMLFEEAAVRNVNLKSKIGASFGSYGWSGEAPKLALEIMKNKFEMQVIEPPLLIRYTPDQTGLENCKEFGKKIAERLMHIT
jgi:flavorubredoxin